MTTHPLSLHTNVTNTVVFYKRHNIIQRLPPSIVDRLPERLVAQHRNYAPLNSFASQRAAGLHSSAFDIESNMAAGDSRMGLDEQGAAEVSEIMRRERVK